MWFLFVVTGLITNLIKKSVTISINAVLFFPLYLQTFLYATFNILWLVAVVLYINLMQTTYVDIFSAFGQWHSLGCSAVKKGKKNQCQHVNSWISELRNSWNYICMSWTCLSIRKLVNFLVISEEYDTRSANHGKPMWKSKGK